MIDELMKMLKTLEQSMEAPSELKAVEPAVKPVVETVGPKALVPEVKEAPEPEEPYMPLLEGCCYMPPLKSCSEDLCKICMTVQTMEQADCDYYIGTLCHLMMHCLCICLDSCDCFDEATMLRETCVSLMQNLEAVVGKADAPDKDALLKCSVKLAKCCAKLEARGLGSDECFDLCVECLKCCLDCLKCLNCDTAVAKLERCIKALC